MIELMLKGGVLMWPIGACSVFALAIILDRAWYFAGITMRGKRLVPKIIAAVKKGRLEEAVELCEKRKIPLTNVIRAILVNSYQSKEVIRESAEEVSLYEVPKLERNLNFLATIAHISPLMGLLGTVTGIIQCFAAIQDKASSLGVVDPTVLAKGIHEALFTTAFGLVVAIPSYIAYNYFVSKVNFKVIEMERIALEVLNLMTVKKNSRSQEIIDKMR